MSQTTLQRILDGGIVAVVRAESPDKLVGVVRALAEGGVTAAEITFTVPDALDVIKEVRKALGDSIVLGAGSVLDPETARAAILAGAEYIVGPSTNLEVIRLCRRYGKVVMPGAFTPTEVVAAWEAGADIVKIFPSDLGGPAHLKALHAPLPQVRMMPTGGVDLCDGRSLLEGGSLLSGCRQLARRGQGGRLGRLRPAPIARRAVRRDRQAVPGRSRRLTRISLAGMTMPRRLAERPTAASGQGKLSSTGHVDEAVPSSGRTIGSFLAIDTSGHSGQAP